MVSKIAIKTCTGFPFNPFTVERATSISSWTRFDCVTEQGCNIDGASWIKTSRRILGRRKFSRTLIGELKDLKRKLCLIILYAKMLEESLKCNVTLYLKKYRMTNF